MTDVHLTGPAIAYTSSLNLEGTQDITLVDRQALNDPRERAICRALLQHALALLDATEPTRKAAGMRVEAQR